MALHFKSNILWSFSWDISVIDCWLVPSCWSDKCSLILLLVLGCDFKFSVGHIQIRDMDFLPLPTWGKSWWGCRLGVTSCWRQLIVFIDIKYQSSSLPKTSFVDFWTLYFAFTGLSFVDPEIFPLMWFQIVCGPNTNWTYRFSSPTVLWTFVARVTVVWFLLSSSIYWMSASKSYRFLPVYLSVYFSSSGRSNKEIGELIY